MKEPRIKLVRSTVEQLSISDLRVSIDDIKRRLEFCRNIPSANPLKILQYREVRDELTKELITRVNDLFYVTVEGRKQ